MNTFTFILFLTSLLWFKNNCVIHAERFTKSIPSDPSLSHFGEKWALTFCDTGIVRLLTVAENVELFLELSNILKSFLESAIWKIYNSSSHVFTVTLCHTQGTTESHCGKSTAEVLSCSSFPTRRSSTECPLRSCAGHMIGLRPSWELPANA